MSLPNLREPKNLRELKNLREPSRVDLIQALGALEIVRELLIG